MNSEHQIPWIYWEAHLAKLVQVDLNLSRSLLYTYSGGRQLLPSSKTFFFHSNLLLSFLGWPNHPGLPGLVSVLKLVSQESLQSWAIWDRWSPGSSSLFYLYFLFIYLFYIFPALSFSSSPASIGIQVILRANWFFTPEAGLFHSLPTPHTLLGEFLFIPLCYSKDLFSVVDAFFFWPQMWLRINSVWQTMIWGEPGSDLLSL